MSANSILFLLKIEIIVIGCFLLANLSRIDFFLENTVITDSRLKGVEGICKDSQKIRQYLQNGGDPNLRIKILRSKEYRKGADWNDYNPLFCSVLQSDEENIKILLNNGAGIDSVSYHFGDSYTALDQAIAMGNIKITKLLIDAGASIDFSEKEIVDDYREPPLFIAVKKGHQEIVELLISHQVDINIKDENGKTAFDYAKDQDILDLLHKYHEAN